MRTSIIFSTGLLLLFISCSDPDPDPEDQPDPITTEQLDFACVLGTACAPAGSDTMSECTTSTMSRPSTGTRFTEEMVTCVEEAGVNCGSVEACLPTSANAECGDVTQGSFCQEDSVVSCFGGQIEYVTDCSQWGLVCAEIDGQALCQGDGPSCLEGTESCDGDEATICAGFREATFNCSRLIRGFTCEMRSGRARCVPTQSDCDSATTPGNCDGDSLVFCSSEGILAQVNCIDLGFSGCSESGDRALCVSE